MKYNIFGNFWRGDIFHDGRVNPAEAMVPFGGDIDLQDDGSFIGVTNDHWGDAEIKGTLKGAILEFTKRYTRVIPGRPVATGLHYLLRGSAINGGHGGWWGTFTQENESHWPAPGQACCTIHPDPNG